MLLIRLNDLIGALGARLRSPLLLIIRLYWGVQFIQTGWGKLTNLHRTAGYFATLGIPSPHLNAVMAGGTEFFGGCLLVLGLFSRITCIPLLVTMAVAYATAEHDALRAIFTDPDQFTAATPFLFLCAVVLVLVFGPGYCSVDHFLGRRKGRSAAD